MVRSYSSPHREAMAAQTRAAVITAVAEELEGPLIELCERVAARAGVSSATVRKLFPRRELLLAAGLDQLLDAASPPEPDGGTTQAVVEAVFSYYDQLGPERLWAAYRHAEESEALQQRVHRIERAVDAALKPLGGGQRSTTAFIRMLLDPLAYRRQRASGVSAATARANVGKAISAVLGDK
jgi:AcrR family transcriptional regulator